MGGSHSSLHTEPLAGPELVSVLHKHRVWVCVTVREWEVCILSLGRVVGGLRLVSTLSASQGGAARAYCSEPPCTRSGQPP